MPRTQREKSDEAVKKTGGRMNQEQRMTLYRKFVDMVRRKRVVPAGVAGGKRA